jgi:hypothetical protein
MTRRKNDSQQQLGGGGSCCPEPRPNKEEHMICGSLGCCTVQNKITHKIKGGRWIFFVVVR